MHNNLYCTKNCTKDVSICDNLCQSATNVLYNFQNKQKLISMKLAVVLENRRVKANGKFSVKIRFNFNKQAYYVATGVEVPAGNFMLGKIIGLPRAAMYNTIIAQKLEYTQNVLDDLQLRGLIKTKFKTGTEIKRFIEAGKDGYETLNRDNKMKLHFKSYVENHLQKYSSDSSSDQYRLMLKKVTAFCDINNLFIPDITTAWLKDFDTFCEKSGMNVNGRAFYLRAIRVIFNDAIDRELIGLDKYPFRRFKIKKADTMHRNMPLADMRMLMKYDCSKSPHLARYRDMFMLSFFLCGMNIKDMLLLKPADLRGGMINTMRFKTNVSIHLKIEPEALGIINRYRGDKYLLNIMDMYGNYDDFRRKLNKYIKIILPYATIYWARHSWATFAAELDIPDPIIDIAQAHKLQGMSSVYISRNLSKVHRANRQVIDYVKYRRRTTQKFKWIKKTTGIYHAMGV